MFVSFLEVVQQNPSRQINRLKLVSCSPDYCHRREAASPASVTGSTGRREKEQVIILSLFCLQLLVTCV